jgi:hypothetical protein
VNSPLNQLIERREALVARCAEQRDQLGQAIDGVRRGAAPLQAALGTWHAVKSRPLLFGLVALVAAVAGPRRLVSMLGTAFTFYSLARRLARLGRRH